MTSLMRRPGTGPITLTPGQFRGTTAGKKPGASYEGYLAYINRRRAAKLQQANQDPFAATPPAAINQTIGKYTGMYGTPIAEGDIQSRAQSLIDPIIAAVTGNINTRAKEATSAIGLNSAAAAKDLAGVDLGAPYAQAKQEQAAVDAALREGLAGDGAGLAGDLRSRLAAIDDPSVGAAADQLAGQGVAAGNTELARGSNAMGSLIAAAAAAKEYGAKQPGIARLAGLQDIAGVQRDATGQIGAQTAEVSKLLPSIVQNFRSENANLRSNKAQAAAQLYGLITGQNVTKATAKAGLQGDAAQLDYNYANSTADQAYRDAQLGISQQNADTAAQRATDAGKPKGPSSASREHALKAIDTYYWGTPAKTRADGSVTSPEVPGIDYPSAVANLMNGFGYTRQQAESLANTRYKPGEDGRPTKTHGEFTQASSQAPVLGQEIVQKGVTYVWNGHDWVKK